MSHPHERKEKVCLNCGANLIGHYCHDCGQENVEPRQSVWHFITHFFNDIIHFEGKFFTTMKLLLAKPGFVAREYIDGRRSKYVNPIRLYLFMSFAFFLILFSLPKPQVTDTEPPANDTNVSINLLGTVEIGHMDADSLLRAYETEQLAKPKAERDNAIMRYLMHVRLTDEAHYLRNPEVHKQLRSNLMHSTMPKLFILSLPLFALGLYVLYWRKRKEYYFVTHAVFAIYFYCVFFLVWTGYSVIVLGGQKAKFLAGIAATAFLSAHIFMAMRRFYRQGTAKTIIKFAIIFGYSLLLFIGLTTIATVYMIISLQHHY